MEPMPNPSVLEMANHHQKASEVLESHDRNDAALRWVACINAAFATELYIKSFLAEPDHIDMDIRYGKRLVQWGGQKTPHIHSLMVAYKKVDEEVRGSIESLSREIDEDFDLLGNIEKCQDYFFKGRYSYEAMSLTALNSVILRLAKHLRLVAHEYSKRSYSVTPESNATI